MKNNLRRNLANGILVALILITASSLAMAQGSLQPPSSLKATAINGQVKLTWIDTNSSETGYVIERSLSPTSGFAVIKTTGKNVVAYKDTGVASGTTYYYRVRAKGSRGIFSPYSSVLSWKPFSVSITSPPSGTTYTTPQTVTLAAQPDIPVKRVQFFDGTTLKGSDTTSPYTYKWTITSANNGIHTWTVKAFDGLGGQAVSSPINLTINIGGSNEPPIVQKPILSTTNRLVMSDFSFKQEGGPSTSGSVGIGLAEPNGDKVVVGPPNQGGTNSICGIEPTNNLYLGKISSTGTCVWVVALPKGAGYDHGDPSAVAEDGMSNIIVSGYFYGTIVFGADTSQPITLVSDSTGAFLAKYSPSGSFLWAVKVGGDLLLADNSVNPDGVYLGGAINIDSDNNIYLSETNGYTGVSEIRMFASATGVQLSKTPPIGPLDLYTEPSGFTYTMKRGDMDIDENMYFIYGGWYSSPSRDHSLARYDAFTGSFAWNLPLVSLPLGSEAYFYEMRIDSEMNVYVYGFFKGSTITFGGLSAPFVPVSAGGGYSNFSAVVSPSGQVLKLVSGRMYNCPLYYHYPVCSL